MNKTLLILAAGLGSRYGGGKQTDSFGPNNETLMEYAIRDAVKFGFDKVVIIISDSMRDWFPAEISKRVGGVELRFVVQNYSSLPAGFTVPEGRTKPYGTTHAMLCAREHLDTPFAVINADDYYGAKAFEDMSAELDCVEGGNVCMVAYPIGRTMSAFGEVTRGICSLDSQGYLLTVAETYKVRLCEDGIIRSFASDESGAQISADAIASMNLFGFSPRFVEMCSHTFEDFLTSLAQDDMRSELPLSIVVDRLVKSGDIRMKVCVTSSEWLGVTYKEDKENVKKRLSQLYC